MTPDQFIIEHLRRGTLVDQEWTDDDESSTVYEGWRTRWSWAGLRTDARIFFSLTEVRMALAHISPRQLPLVSVRRFGGQWEVVPDVKPAPDTRRHLAPRGLHSRRATR